MDANYVQRLALGSLMIILVITTTPTALATAILPPAATTGLSGLTQPLPGDDMLRPAFRPHPAFALPAGPSPGFGGGHAETILNWIDSLYNVLVALLHFIKGNAQFNIFSAQPPPNPGKNS